MLTDGDVSEHFFIEQNEKQTLPNPPCEGGKLMGTETKNRPSLTLPVREGS